MDVGGRATQEQFAEGWGEAKSSSRAACVFPAENREHIRTPALPPSPGAWESQADCRGRFGSLAMTAFAPDY